MLEIQTLLHHPNQWVHKVAMYPKFVVNLPDQLFRDILARNHQSNNIHSPDNVIRIPLIKDYPIRGYQAIPVIVQHNPIRIPHLVDKQPEIIER